MDFSAEVLLRRLLGHFRVVGGFLPFLLSVSQHSMTTIRRQRFKHIIGRTVLLIFGMFLAAFGIACTTTAGLGTTPISTVPYTASAITGLSFGTCTVILNFFSLLGRLWSCAAGIRHLICCKFQLVSSSALSLICQCIS